MHWNKKTQEGCETQTKKPWLCVHQDVCPGQIPFILAYFALFRFRVDFKTLRNNSGPCRLQRYDESLVHTLLNSLRPDPPAESSLSRPRVTVTAKDFEEAATEREKWFDVPYQARFL